MATLEKPRIKKKKKTRHSRESQPEGQIPNAYVELAEELDEPLDIQEVTKETEKQAEEPQIAEEDEVEVDPGQAVAEEVYPRAEQALVVDEIPEPQPLEIPKPSAPPLEAPCERFLIREISQLYPVLGTISREPLQRTKLLEFQIEPFSVAQLRDLYSNNLLSFARELEKEFIETELHPSFLRNGDYLHQCLQEYLHSLTECRTLTIEQERLKGICESNQDKLWSILDVNQEFSGICSDGNRVSTTVSFKRAIFNENILELVFGNFSEIRSVCCDKFVKCSTLGALYKMKIDEEIVRIQAQHISANAQEFLNGSEELRHSISVLFYFLRKPSVEKIFVGNVKSWLGVVVNLLLDVATWPDHMFLLHHILRCPPGIIAWAAPMIQIPVGDFSTDSLQNHVSVQHSLTVLHAILLPIARRGEFLDEVLCWSRMAKQGEWSFVDSDGEEDVDVLVLRENDLVRVFNQIPWRNLFSLATKMLPLPGGGYDVQKDAITAHSVLQFFAFASYVVETTGMGLCTYNTGMYRQFTKRLARLVTHCVQYAAGIYSIFQGATAVNDVLVRARIQTEFEQLLVRACDQIYMSRTAGAWQYLVGLPFNQLSPTCIGKLYRRMRSPHFGDSSAEEVIEERNREADYSLVQIFEANDISPEDLHYLLQTLANLASTSPILRPNVVADLLEIGFLRGSTKDDCSKIARDLIANLADECPELITDIIQQFQKNTLEGSSYGTYLLKRLPMLKWKPGPDIIDVLEEWLCDSALESSENGMARIVINNMNWNYTNDGQLFLPRTLHTRMALIIYQADVKKCSTTSNFIAENVRNLVKDKSTVVNFHTWCWKMISILKLHATDGENAAEAIFSPEFVLPEIPDLEQMHQVSKGLRDNRPLAIYLSVLLTQRGHSIAQISTYTFRNMEVLLKIDEQITALRCLQIVFPLFLTYPESLVRNTAFTSFLHQIFSLDSTYAKMTVDMIFTKNVSEIIKLFGKMIVSQFVDYQRFGLHSPTPLVMLWLQCLTAYKDYRHCWNALYILNVILKFAFAIPEAWYEARKLFTSLTREIRLTGTPTKSSFLSKATPIGLIPHLPVTTIWLGLMICDVQHEIFECETGFWLEFVHHLSLQTVRNMDEVVKKVGKSMGTTHTQSNDLIFTKLMNFIISCPTSHTALVLLCQRFFALYLTKVPSSQGCVRDRLYAANEMLMKRIRGQLESAQKHHEALAVEQQEVDDVLSGFHANLAREFQTFAVLLDGKGSGMLVFQSGLINLAPLLQNQRQCNEDWNAKLGRQIPRHTVTLSKSNSQEYSHNIQKHLMSYDTPVPRPSHRKMASAINLPSPEEYTKGGIFSSSMCSSDFNLLEKYAKAFASNIQEMCSLDRNFGNLAKGKLVNEKEVRYEIVSCTYSFSNRECTGPANVRITQNRIITIESAERNITSNRKQNDVILSSTMKQLPDDLLRALLRMEQTLKTLTDQCSHRKNERRCTTSCRIAFELLAKTLKSSMDFLTVYPPTNSLTQSVIKTLGHFMPSHLQQEGQRLVESMLKGSIFTDFLLNLFTPEVLAPREFLTTYETTIASFGKMTDQEVIAVILEKFHITQWLEVHQPDLVVRENLTHLILRGLKVSTHRNSAANDKIFRLHLIEVFKHRFPLSYNSTMRILFDGFTKLGLSGVILVDLLNTLLGFYGLGGISADGSQPTTYEYMEHFAGNQQILTQMDLMETIKWLSEFFAEVRRNDGIYGLFPRFKNLYHIFNLFMGIILHATVCVTIQTFPGATADQLSEWIWVNIRDVYSMWVIPVAPDATMPQGNWMKYQIDGVSLLPWSESTKNGPREMLQQFVRCTNFAILSIQGNSSILRHVFLWYVGNFSSTLIPTYITTTVHEALDKLPWETFDPNMEILNVAAKVFCQKHADGSRKYVANILKKVPWIEWYTKNVWNYVEKCEAVSLLFKLFVPIAAYGDDVDGMLVAAEAAIHWEFVDGTAFTDTLEVFSQAAGAPWCRKLKAASPNGKVEKALWKLLRKVARFDLTGDDAKSSKAITKRLTFVRMVVQFLIQSVDNSKEFFASKDGKQIFQDIFVDLLKDVQKILDNDQDFPKEGLNILVEIVREVPQDAEGAASKLLVEGLASWEISHPAAVVALLHAIAMSRKASEPLNALLEATIDRCFSSTSTTSWGYIQEIIWNYMAAMRPTLIGQKDLNCLHLQASVAFRSERDCRKRLALMGLIFEQLNGLIVGEENELKVAILWGFLCATSFRECDRSPENKIFLIHVTKRLIHMASEQQDWGKLMLSAIGINRLARSKVLWKCLACYMTELLKVCNVDCDFERERCALNVELQAKQYNPYREAISEIQRHVQGDLVHQGRNIATLLRKFYDGENLLNEIEIMWS